LSEGGSPINQRVVVSLALAVVVGVALVSTISLARRPVLGAPLVRTDAARPAAHVQKTTRSQELPQPDRGQQLPRYECGSTAFVDYAEGATGEATPLAAVRSYRPGARDLRIQTLGSDRALVEEVQGAVKIAAYEVFRVEKAGWLVTRADKYESCGAPQ